MKVTIEISDAVLEEAKDFALREGTTVDALAEDAMRQILKGQREGAALAPEEAPLQNDVLSPVAHGSWDHIGAAFGDSDA
jgi:hypothetical protein